jgi:hypothetical protein
VWNEDGLKRIGIREILFTAV